MINSNKRNILYSEIACERVNNQVGCVVECTVELRGLCEFSIAKKSQGLEELQQGSKVALDSQMPVTLQRLRLPRRPPSCHPNLRSSDYQRHPRAPEPAQPPIS